MLKAVVLLHIFVGTVIHYHLKVSKIKKLIIYILLLSKDALHSFKETIQTFMLQKISISNKCCSFELSIYQRIFIKESWFPQKY